WWADEQARAAPDQSAQLRRATRLIGSVLVALLVLIFFAVLLEGLGVPIVVLAQRWLSPAAQPYAPWVSDIVRAQRWTLLALLLFAGLATAGVIRAARTPNWLGVFAGVFCAMVALVLSISQVILPGIARRQSPQALMARIREVIDPAERLFFFKAFDYGA